MKKLPSRAYLDNDVKRAAKCFLGKLLVSNIDNVLTSGRIVEVEAYEGVSDRASHAYGGRRTKRTEIMYGEGGSAYVYLCYGIHHLFNIVTNKKEIPHAVLLRGLEPVEGIPEMIKRYKTKITEAGLTKGPGNLSRALGIKTSHSGTPLNSDLLFIADDGFKVNEEDIVTTTRVGVDYAGEDALLPYRFYLKGNKYVSKK